MAVPNRASDPARVANVEVAQSVAGIDDQNTNTFKHRYMPTMGKKEKALDNLQYNSSWDSYGGDRKTEHLETALDARSNVRMRNEYREERSRLTGNKPSYDKLPNFSPKTGRKIQKRGAVKNSRVAKENKKAGKRTPSLFKTASVSPRKASSGVLNKGSQKQSQKNRVQAAKPFTSKKGK